MIKSQTTIVKSTTVDSLYYDAVSKELMVTFKSEVTYTYFEVTLEDYFKVITSESIGSALNKTIKGVYNYQKHEKL